VRVTACRIFKKKHAATSFTGEGARLHGGRWNSKGKAVVYTAASCSLATLEMLVQLDDRQVMDEYVCAFVSFDRRLVRTVDSEALPKNWREYPGPPELKTVGDQWLTVASSAVLQVPNAIVASEFNFLINPAHTDFRKIRIEEHLPFLFDPRLLK
jgi:RES domain-containing protein